MTRCFYNWHKLHGFLVTRPHDNVLSLCYRQQCRSQAISDSRSGEERDQEEGVKKKNSGLKGVKFLRYLYTQQYDNDILTYA